jgi:hypothetical protein
MCFFSVPWTSAGFIAVNIVSPRRYARRERGPARENWKTLPEKEIEGNLPAAR